MTNAENGRLSETLSDQTTELGTKHEERQAEQERRGFGTGRRFTTDRGGYEHKKPDAHNSVRHPHFLPLVCYLNIPVETIRS